MLEPTIEPEKIVPSITNTPYILNNCPSNK
uniref:Uncharacterized protein n=1 Tax=Arundo donax TaxID=35708 RepID=A0A0A8ZAI4_ARUDO